MSSQKRDVTNVIEGINCITNEAIRIVEAFLGASSVLPQVRDTWKRQTDLSFLSEEVS